MGKWHRNRKKNVTSTASPENQGKRVYAAAQHGRFSSDWVAQSTSADAEIWNSLRTLRNRSRSLCRDNDYAIGALRTIISNVLADGGIRLESKVTLANGNGKLNNKLNRDIEALWSRWGEARFCDVAGRLNWPEFERLVLRSIIESGECLIRLIRQPFRGSPVALALQIIESDQLADDYSLLLKPIGGNVVKMGVEVNVWNEPQAYWIYPYHPGDNYLFNTDRQRSQPIRVPANEVIHLYVSDRPGQTRGVPWLSSAILRLRHMGGYEEAEIIAARAAACMMMLIETPSPEFIGEASDDGGKKEITFEPGTVQTLGPGEKVAPFVPNRPNQALDPFMRFMLRAVSVGAGVGYEELAHDYSQTSYGSQRASMLEARRYWKSIQAWFSRSFHQAIYEQFLDMCVLGGAINLPQYEAIPWRYACCRWMPPGWTWIDPSKDVKASVEAISAGLSTLTRELAFQGIDFEDFVLERQQETERLDQAGLTVGVYDSKGKPDEPKEPQIMDGFAPVRSAPQLMKSIRPQTETEDLDAKDLEGKEQDKINVTVNINLSDLLPETEVEDGADGSSATADPVD